MCEISVFFFNFENPWPQKTQKILGKSAVAGAEVMPPTEPSAAESRASRVLNLDVEDEQYMA